MYKVLTQQGIQGRLLDCSGKSMMPQTLSVDSRNEHHKETRATIVGAMSRSTKTQRHSRAAPAVRLQPCDMDTLSFAIKSSRHRHEGKMVEEQLSKDSKGHSFTANIHAKLPFWSPRAAVGPCSNTHFHRQSLLQKLKQPPALCITSNHQHISKHRILCPGNLQTKTRVAVHCSACSFPEPRGYREAYLYLTLSSSPSHPDKGDWATSAHSSNPRTTQAKHIVVVATEQRFLRLTYTHVRM